MIFFCWVIFIVFADEKTKWFSNKKGYGYIEYKKDGNVMVHFYNSDGLKEIEFVTDRINSFLKEKEKTI